MSLYIRIDLMIELYTVLSVLLSTPVYRYLTGHD